MLNAVTTVIYIVIVHIPHTIWNGLKPKTGQRNFSETTQLIPLKQFSWKFCLFWCITHPVSVDGDNSRMRHNEDNWEEQRAFHRMYNYVIVFCIIVCSKACVQKEMNLSENRVDEISCMRYVEFEQFYHCEWASFSIRWVEPEQRNAMQYTSWCHETNTPCQHRRGKLLNAEWTNIAYAHSKYSPS